MKKDILKRVLCLACCLSLTLGMFAYRPAKAQAVVVDATAAFGAAAATAAINGTTASTLFTGMTTSAATNGIILYMDSYAAATGAAASGTALASTIGAGTVITAAGSLVLGAAAAIALIKFVEWLRDDTGLEPGGDPVTIAGAETGMFRCGDVVVPALPAAPSSTYFNYLIYQYSSRDLGLMILPSGVVVRADGYLGSTGSYSIPFYTFTPGSSAWTFISNISCSSGSSIVSRDDMKTVYWSSHDILNPSGAVAVPASAPPVPLYESGTEVVVQPNEEIQELPDAIPEGQTMVISPGIADLPQDDPQAAADAIMQPIIDGALNPTVTIEADPTVTPDPDPDGSTGADPDTGTETDPDATTGWLSRILESIKALPQQIAEAVGNIISSIFAPDAELVNEITGTFSEKFGFVETLKIIGDDLFGMTPSSEPPVVWIHLEDAEGKYYYGGTVKALDMSWFQRYKEDVDRILGGFLWVAYLWLLFRRLPDILGGAGLVIADSQYIGDGMYVDGSTGEITGRFMYRRSKRL